MSLHERVMRTNDADDAVDFPIHSLNHVIVREGSPGPVVSSCPVLWLFPEIVFMITGLWLTIG
jgi:hypothetical protein